jgi:phage shock protein A
MSQSILAKLRVITLSNIHTFLDAVKSLNSIGEYEQYIRDIEKVRNQLDDQSAALRGRKSYLETQIASAEVKIAVANENIDLVLGDDDPTNDHIAVNLQVELDAAEKKVAQAQAELETILPQVSQFDDAVMKLNAKLQEASVKLESLKSLEETTNVKEKASKALSNINFGDEPDTSGVESKLYQKSSVADNSLQRSLGEMTASIGSSSGLDLAKAKIAQRKKRLEEQKKGGATN